MYLCLELLQDAVSFFALKVVFFQGFNQVLTLFFLKHTAHQMMHLNIQYVILHFAQSVAATAIYHATGQVQDDERIR